MVAFLLALLAVPEAAPAAQEILPREVSESLSHALAIPGARIVPLAWSAPAGCRVRRASVPRAIDGSGRVAVKFVGNNCSGWGWVRLGDLVRNRGHDARHACRRGRGVGVRHGRAGSAARPHALRSARRRGGGAQPARGNRARSTRREHELCGGRRSREDRRGGWSSGHRDPRDGVSLCAPSRACAVLSTGKHVEGRMDDGGRLIVEVPDEGSMAAGSH
jgi:hypothetical protein